MSQRFLAPGFVMLCLRQKADSIFIVSRGQKRHVAHEIHWDLHMVIHLALDRLLPHLYHRFDFDIWQKLSRLQTLTGSKVLMSEPLPLFVRVSSSFAILT